ncbi:MAG: asparagine synthase (glutamine-hydrolyzing) [Pyrinomonadaceae bacterium]|nr:asparagine synthase (glutamine-hydrolyzing) [Pyrinomonadaceae bacterium]MCX7639131.1 asparagine synthase (glutamine-hydrolyzing) [Pyrinomonadaceae bacterium]MDW8303648.1 asparagine synthase (glutamine-hydrolyzing) [Acidobacteriota bacterium]
MCGIAGWFDFEGGSPSSSKQVLSSMCKEMTHRGPDSEGFWFGDEACLGMRRLSIIDLETGDQPVFNENKTVVAVMNGEVYNFRELRKELENRGHSFRTKSDTEILPHLYEEFGEEMVKHLNGMFAFALWDALNKKLLIARDRFGEKPLYYGFFDKKLIFASEPKVLLRHPSVSKKLDLKALQYYLSFDYVPAPLSIYEGIRKLPPAHVLKVDKGKVFIEKYWKLTFSPKLKVSFREASEELRRLLEESVNMRLISDVPLGVLLSGGIDSSTVAYFASQKEKTKTFSIGFNEASFDESYYSRIVARHLGTEHHEEVLNVEKAYEIIFSVGKWLDEPLSDSSLIPTYLLSRFVRREVKVALGGDGGDEIFAGYPMYFAHKVAKIYEKIPRFFRRNAIEPLVNSLPVSAKNLPFDYRAKRFVMAADYDMVARHHLWFGSFSTKEQERLLKKEVFDSVKIDIYDLARESLSECDATDDVERAQFLDMQFYLAEDILAKVDRASMAVSLEVRAPFLDHRIAEFVAKLPVEYKLKGGKGKRILKEVMKKALPEEILNRRKKGFGMPIAEWINTSLKPLIDDLLSPAKIKQQGLFDENFVQKLLLEHRERKKSNHKQIWTLLIFQTWYDNFMK